jgi:hypothetical protein
MQLPAGVYPDVFSYHPTWKGGATHPAIPARSAVVDQVVFGAHGGDWSDEAKLVTACPLAHQDAEGPAARSPSSK